MTSSELSRKAIEIIDKEIENATKLLDDDLYDAWQVGYISGLHAAERYIIKAGLEENESEEKKEYNYIALSPTCA